eukprot:s248_g6.t1
MLRQKRVMAWMDCWGELVLGSPGWNTAVALGGGHCLGDVVGVGDVGWPGGLNFAPEPGIWGPWALIFEQPAQKIVEPLFFVAAVGGAPWSGRVIQDRDGETALGPAFCWRVWGLPGLLCLLEGCFSRGVEGLPLRLGVGDGWGGVSGPGNGEAVAPLLCGALVWLVEAGRGQELVLLDRGGSGRVELDGQDLVVADLGRQVLVGWVKSWLVANRVLVRTDVPVADEDGWGLMMQGCPDVLHCGLHIFVKVMAWSLVDSDQMKAAEIQVNHVACGAMPGAAAAGLYVVADRNSNAPVVAGLVCSSRGLGVADLAPGAVATALHSSPAAGELTRGELGLLHADDVRLGLGRNSEQIHGVVFAIGVPGPDCQWVAGGGPRLAFDVPIIKEIALPGAFAGGWFWAGPGERLEFLGGEGPGGCEGFAPLAGCLFPGSAPGAAGQDGTSMLWVADGSLADAPGGVPDLGAGRARVPAGFAAGVAEVMDGVGGGLLVQQSLPGGVVVGRGSALLAAKGPLVGEAPFGSELARGVGAGAQVFALGSSHPVVRQGWQPLKTIATSPSSVDVRACWDGCVPHPVLVECCFGGV